MKIDLNKIIQGDVLKRLKEIPDDAVDCIITSPPYWGLRDYGTGTWKGGDPKCDHQAPRNKNRNKAGTKQSTSKGSNAVVWSECQKCGAKRTDDQLGLEKTPEDYIVKMTEIFTEAKRVLKKTGTLWLNLGDTYSAQRWSNNKGTSFMQIGKNSKKNEVIEKESNLPDKNLVGIPWRVALALQSSGWILRQDIIWHKPNPMPESVKDRCTKAHEYIFLFCKSQKYHFEYEAIQEPANYDGRKDEVMKGSSKYLESKIPGQQAHTFASQGHKRWQKNKDGVRVRNRRSVWIVNTKPFKEAHFATFPEDLIVPMVKAGCPPEGIVMDPFMGSGTTGLVAKKLGRNYLGIELNPEYIKMAEKRINSLPTPMI